MGDAKRFRCEALTEDDVECGAPAEWETDDLGDIHHMCDPHNRELMAMNDFNSERCR